MESGDIDLGCAAHSFRDTAAIIQNQMEWTIEWKPGFILKLYRSTYGYSAQHQFCHADAPNSVRKEGFAWLTAGPTASVWLMDFRPSLGI